MGGKHIEDSHSETMAPSLRRIYAPRGAVREDGESYLHRIPARAVRDSSDPTTGVDLDASFEALGAGNEFVVAAVHRSLREVETG